MNDVLLIYVLVINIIGFLAMGIDKAKAKVGAWRIPEKTLLSMAVLGGAIGVWIGMETFRHKTKHWYFKYGMPFIFILQILLITFITK